MSMRRWNGALLAAAIAVLLPAAAMACDEHAAGADAKDAKAVASKDAGCGKGCCAKSASTAKAKATKTPAAKTATAAAKPQDAPAPVAAPTAPGAGR